MAHRPGSGSRAIPSGHQCCPWVLEWPTDSMRGMPDGPAHHPLQLMSWSSREASACRTVPQWPQCKWRLRCGSRAMQHSSIVAAPGLWCTQWPLCGSGMWVHTLSCPPEIWNAELVCGSGPVHIQALCHSSSPIGLDEFNTPGLEHFPSIWEYLSSGAQKNSRVMGSGVEEAKGM